MRDLLIVIFSFIAIGFACTGGEKNITTVASRHSKLPIINWTKGRVIGTLAGHDVHVIVIDSCEYLVVGGGVRESLTHKGNCKFCEERRRRDKNKY